MPRMLTAIQCRMARAALAWGMKDLAQRSGVSANTIDRFENGRAAPIPANLKALREAFEAAGIEFTNGEAPGVKLHPRKP